MTFFNGFQPENIIKIITRNMGFQPLIAVSQNFSDLKTVPSVYWIKDGEVMNKLPIVDKENQSYIFTEWVEDNEAYFNERLGDDK